MAKNNVGTGGLAANLLHNADRSIGGEVLRAGGCVLLGFLSARAQIFDKCAPFGIAAVAAAGPGNGLFVLLGTMLGYMLPMGPEYAFRYVATVVAVFLFKLVLSGFKELCTHPAFVPALAGVSSAITGAAVLVAGGITPYDSLVYATETLLCACMAYFFLQSAEFIKRPTGLWGLSQRELISVTISVCVLLLALERLQFSGISLGRIVAAVAVLCAARYGKESGGAIMGITAGMAMSLGGGASGLLAGFGFGGLIAGVFAPMGRLFCTAAFLLACAVAGVTSSETFTQALTCAYELSAAAVIFILLPESLLCRVSALFVPSRGPDERSIRESICTRMVKAADTLDEIAEMVSQVRGKLNRIGTGDRTAVFDEAASDVCEQCGMRMYCWGTVYNDTMNVFNDACDALRKKRILTKDDMQKHFVSRCCRLSDLLDVINRHYAEFTARRAAELKTEQLRRLFAPSLGNAACLMRDIAADFASGKRQASGGGRVRAALASCGLSASTAQLFLDARGRMTVEAQIDGKSVRVGREKLLKALCQSCGRELSGPVMLEDGESDAVRLRFFEKPRFTVRFGEAVIQKTGETLCGDACESFVDEQGRAMMLLSDGMGCGGSAAVDSNLTVRLMSRLLRCGFAFDEAARITGTAMMVKSGEESFATLDIACIDLYDGTATILKAGAPATYLRRCGRVERIEPSSMPIGILSETKLEKATVRLRAGDMVVVLSDGAVSQDDSFIVKAVESFSGDPKEFARRLAQTAKELRSDGHDDDITVMAAEIA